jgi:hypothetical protein
MALAQVIGPPLAAPLLIAFGVQWALIVNAASFGISFLCIRAVHPPAGADEGGPERASFGVEFRAGIRFFFGNKLLVTVGVGIVIAMLGNAAPCTASMRSSRGWPSARTTRSSR